MSRKAKHCDECVHWVWRWNGPPHCDKGHKPMFYKPKPDPRDDDWGFKRVCDDFEGL